MEVVELVVTLAAGDRTLAGQFLVLQLTVLLAVLAVSSVVSVQQSDADFRDTRGARLRAAAENLAGTVRRCASGLGRGAAAAVARVVHHSGRRTIYNASGGLPRASRRDSGRGGRPDRER